MLTVTSSKLTLSSSYSYSCVMINLPETLSKNIKSWCKNEISNVDIFTDGGTKGREPTIHCTVKYGLITNSSKDIKDIVSNFGAIDCKLGEISRFTPHNEHYDVIKVELISEKLGKLNSLLCELENKDKHDVYKPHVTIAYIKSGTNRNMSGDKEFAGKSFSISEVVFSPAKGEKETISLI